MTVRVLWLAKGLGRGGAEQLLVTSAPHLDPERFVVDVAYVLPWKDALVPRLEAEGLRVHCLGPGRLGWVRRLRTLLRTHDYDVVHAHMPLPAVASRLLVRKGVGAGRAHLVYTEHNVWQRYRLPTRLANALTYRRNDAVIAVSGAVRDSIASPWADASKVEVLHHGVEHPTMRRGEQARREARALLGLPDDAFVVGTVGNFTPKKDHRTLLLAFQQLRRRVPGARLVMVGSGPLEAATRQLVDELGLAGSVHLLGMRDDVPLLVPGLDVFCLSSLHEGLSIALVEAMASGVPGVCTAVGGVPEVITDGVDGRLVQPSDPTALAKALDELTDPSVRARMAEQAVERSHHFDIGIAMRRIEDVYDEVMARP